MKEIYIVSSRHVSTKEPTLLKAFGSLDKASNYIRERKTSERMKKNPTFTYLMNSVLFDDDE